MRLSVCAFLFCIFLPDRIAGFGPYLLRDVFRSQKKRPWRNRPLQDTESFKENNRGDPKKWKGESKYFIPPEQIEQLQQSVDLVSVIESYQLPQFKRTGVDRATCLCPFHDDTNPSMSIDGNRGIFKCFSCGAGGNVFTFVREYSKLLGESEELSFYQTVKLVNDKYADGVALNLAKQGGKAYVNAEAKRIEKAKKKRILQANLAAAAFFEECLISLPTAGSARSHLRNRGMGPNTVRAFAMGFAPDVYFGPNKSGYNNWGKGSLVEHLKDKGFTPQEILDAGLATRINKKKQKSTKQETNTTKTDIEEIDYTLIMDRFRGRLVVPIFDGTGKEILGFGGRILDTIHDDKSDFKAAKYINSPESAVFQKKNILFGQHMAKKSLRFWEDQGKDETRPVVIVEGYMDAIALWQAGVREAVASMGTALTSKQLDVAAKIAGTRNGRIVLCMDNDNAGINAVERLCSGNILSETTDRFPIEIRIASLPPGIKDPADYLEDVKSLENPEEKFRADIVGNSLEWTDWFVNHVVSSYDSSTARGAPGSFGDIFERLASFLSTFKNAAERTKRACEVAALLSEIIATDGKESNVSKTVRIQLETDLVEKAAAIANSKTTMKQRISEHDRHDGIPQATLYNIASGDGTMGIDESSKLSKFSARKGRGKQNDTPPDSDGSFKPPSRSLKGSRYRMKRSSKPREVTLTPHFSGIDFLDETDERWLGLIDDQGRRRKDSFLFANTANEMGEINDLKQKKLVYFNSNEFHGNQFLTKEAALAGYKDEKIRPDPNIFEKGVGSLVKIEEDKLSMSTEDSLLRMLLMFPFARKAIKAARDVSFAAGSDGTVTWSSPARAWLFSCLVDNENDIPSDTNGLTDLTALRSYFVSLPDSYPGAFASGSSVVSEIEDENGLTISSSAEDKSRPEQSTDLPLSSKVESSGELDYFFDESEDIFGNLNVTSIWEEERAQLAVQELYSTLLWTSERRRLSGMQQNLNTALALLQERKEPEEDGTDGEMKLLEGESKSKAQIVPIGEKELEDLCSGLVVDIHNSAEKVNNIAKSTRQLSKRLLDSLASSTANEGDISVDEVGRLEQRLREHMSEVNKWSLPPPQSSSSEEENEEMPYEDLLERAQLEYGELYEDGRMWSIEDITTKAQEELSEMVLSDSNELVEGDEVREDTEALDDFMTRIDNDWGWLDDMEEEDHDIDQVFNSMDDDWIDTDSKIE